VDSPLAGRRALGVLSHSPDVPPAPDEDLQADAQHESERHALLDDVGDGHDEHRRQQRGGHQLDLRAGDSAPAHARMEHPVRVEAALSRRESEDAFLDAYKTWRLAAKFAPMWIAANWSFNTSLCGSCGTGTSVPDSAPPSLRISTRIPPHSASHQPALDRPYTAGAVAVCPRAPLSLSLSHTLSLAPLVRAYSMLDSELRERDREIER